MRAVHMQLADDMASFLKTLALHPEALDGSLSVTWCKVDLLGQLVNKDRNGVEASRCLGQANDEIHRHCLPRLCRNG